VHHRQTLLHNPPIMKYSMVVSEGKVHTAHTRKRTTFSSRPWLSQQTSL